MRRFRSRRKRAVLMLVPAAAIMISTNLALASTGALSGSSAAETTTERVASRVALRVKAHVRSGRTATLRGEVRPGGRRWVTVKVGKRKVKTVRSRGDGSFKLRWGARRPGVYKAVAVVRGTDRAKPARSRAKRINVYRPAAASWYGPGFYGATTACGRTLGASTLGVANKTLPCGSKVTLRYRGRTATVPVIDRGPYAGDREYDLTGATKAKLGFPSTGVVLSTK